MNVTLYYLLSLSVRCLKIRRFCLLRGRGLYCDGTHRGNCKRVNIILMCDAHHQKIQAPSLDFWGNIRRREKKGHLSFKNSLMATFRACIGTYLCWEDDVGIAME